MKHLFILLILPVFLAAQEETVYLSLPSCVSAVQENPDAAKKAFASLSFPQNEFIVRLESEIRREVRKSNDPAARECLRRRETQYLAAKTVWLYSQANANPEIGRVLLRLVGLTDTLPFRANDDLFDLLQPALWKGDARLKAQALRSRPELKLRENAVLRLQIEIQFDMANALFDQASDNPEKRLLPLIELLLTASEPFPSLYPPEPELTEREPLPELIPTAFPVQDLFLNLFRAVDWSAY